MATASKSKPAGKRKRVVLSIDDKKLIDKNVSYSIWNWKKYSVWHKKEQGEYNGIQKASRWDGNG